MQPSMSPLLPLGRVLVIAGSDSGGGAGLQADIKTITLRRGYATTAVTAITVQNTLGVSDVYALPTALVMAQAAAVLSDIGTDVIKTGMLGAADLIEAVGDCIQQAQVAAVIDPVMVAKGGARLLPERAIGAVITHLIPRATLLTPNAPEAAALTGLPIETLDDLRRASEALLTMGARAVLMKGGHLAGNDLTDLLITCEGEVLFTAPRQDTRHTHGTGCTLASACAAGLARGLPLQDAVGEAWAYVQEAIAQAPGLGAGHGPLGHGWPLSTPAWAVR